MAKKSILLLVERDADADTFGNYSFSITGMRAVTLLDRMLFWALRKLNARRLVIGPAKSFTITGPQACSLDVFPGPEIQKAVWSERSVKI